MDFLHLDLSVNVLIGIFASFIAIFLIMDLGIFDKKARVISFKSALYQTIFWVSSSLLFGALVWSSRGDELGIQYISAYLMEWSLSVDNIFLFLLLFSYFNIAEKNYHRVLLWGILGAILFRALFIVTGIALINQFHWVLYIFGVILIYTGLKMAFTSRESGFDPDKSFVYKFLKKHLRLSDTQEGFTTKVNGKLHFTTLFLVLILIETTDIIFAIDSIPAVFAISQDLFVVFTSNIFAVFGLRAMFFLLSGLINKFRYLQQGISLILVFIGSKMLLEIFDIFLATKYSLMIILIFLGLSILLSLLNPRRNNKS